MLAQRKTHLSKEKEITSSQVEILVSAAATFVAKLSSNSAIARASNLYKRRSITHIENKGETKR